MEDRVNPFIRALLILVVLVLPPMLGGCLGQIRTCEAPPPVPSAPAAWPGHVDVVAPDSVPSRERVTVEIVLNNTGDEPMSFRSYTLGRHVHPVESRSCAPSGWTVAGVDEVERTVPAGGTLVLDEWEFAAPAEGEVLLLATFVRGGWNSSREMWSGSTVVRVDAKT